MKFLDNVGDPSYFQTLLPDCLFKFRSAGSEIRLRKKEEEKNKKKKKKKKKEERIRGKI